MGADFRTMFSAAAVGSIFGSGPATVTVALELLGYGIIPTSQFIFWDDVQFNAQVPGPTSNSLTTFVVEPTSTIASTTTNEAHDFDKSRNSNAEHGSDKFSDRN